MSTLSRYVARLLNLIVHMKTNKIKVRFLKKSGILAEEFTNILKNRYNDGLKYIFIENYIS